MQPLATAVAWYVSVCVCLLVTRATPTRNEMPFGLRTRVGPRNHALGGCRDPQGKKQSWGDVLPYYKVQGESTASCKNGWCDQHAVWDEDWSGPCVRWGPNGKKAILDSYQWSALGCVCSKCRISTGLQMCPQGTERNGDSTVSV